MTKTSQITLRLEKDLLQAIKKESKAADITKAEVIRLALRKALMQKDDAQLPVNAWIMDGNGKRRMA